MNKNLISQAFLKSLPIMVGYLVIGFGFGILLRDAGYGLLWAIAMSLFIYAGSMQYVGVSLITAPATLFMTILTTFMINARHLFYSISMISRYKDAGKFKPYLIFALTDETYALVSDNKHPKGNDRYVFWFLISLFNHFYWILGTAFGSVFAKSLPFDTSGITFSMTAIFVAAYTEQWMAKKHRISAIIGILVTLLARIIFGSDMFLIPSMLVIAAILLLLRTKLSKGD
ncbi:AzlC family ABC transporter permease [Campylobacter blaseri]|nr:AzlC family ABC transporter permease [Campylobacter blaseri]